ncbi:hypothetical protein PHYBLDRAFT_168947 [Phycomyces blakesleeanus NRRL 1555(-)]|uniref:Endonuclease/exonuclease/phosphatase domain-containing protein n=1 Tax=Phycomyces blakesleeanus (strain ATCC 8743b / DSM 1359 / FGSC 10004 / NBRC 33097 / NRRL 1555) TaxID=763407 RepID=A0A162U1C6_PHYB8|nr:hypothetical protein PHYBLDRAFT_168947 [Phycomyces blakesleeanus NRRL 1555(-)]OAD72682.1 hypothetical protein PHYBLDRAFT_168947 [Phycomyces blakesleeanus NRRL 1555(-)]|eukprot:XP_018290722.1 hypothetical protein PHYBLDRAFT_168947 [Phycomyces blakesleeanus NRRL 1555(-)]
MANLQIGNMQGLPTELTSFLTTLQAQIMNVQNRTDQLERLAAENARLTTELDYARTTIANLQKQLGSQSAPEKNFSEISLSNPAGAVGAPDKNKEPGLEASTWATKASVSLPVTAPKMSTVPSARRIAASVRMFALPSGPSGYEYVYIPRSRRLKHKEVRSSLRTLGVDSSRLLDINFPARGVIGILVHVQYADTFKAKLTNASVEILDAFDPLDPDNVADPKYASLSTHELANTAAMLHHDRCLQALQFLRPHVAIPVGHFFCEEGWISEDEIPTRTTLTNATGGSLFKPGTYRGSMGVSVLISPHCPYAVTQIPMPSKYALAVKIGSLRIVCLYLPPNMPTHDVLHVLSSIPLTHDTILCGDFNARLGSVTGDYASNSRGLALCSWIEERSLSVVNADLAPCIPTYISFRNNYEISSIIDLFITNMPLINPSLHIATDLSLGSDHRLLSLSFTYDLQHSTNMPPPLRKTWNLSRLNEPDVHALYAHTFNQNSTSLLSTLQDIVQNPPLTRPNIDAITDEFNLLIYDSLNSSIGHRPSRPNHWKSFWNVALQTAADRRNQCYKKWRLAIGIDKVVWWTKHKHAQAEFRSQVQQAKRQSWHVFCQSMERDFSKATSKIKQLKRHRQPQHTFQHDDGPAVAAATMCDYLATVYSGHILPATRPPAPMTTCNSVPFASDDSPFTSPIVEEFMQFMPNRKAPGPDHIRAEMLKPFAGNGHMFQSIATHRRSGTLATMATLNSVGACRSGFSLLLSSRLYKTFVRPKFEYGLAISTLLKQDIKVLESIQDKCLRMIVGGHATSSTIVLKHICNLPSMKFRADALMAKFCIRSRFLPAQCLLSLLHRHHTIYSSLVSLGKTHLLSNLPPTLKLRSPSAVKNHFESIREAGFATFLQSNTQVLIQACRPVLGVDPILFLPASRVERSRLIRWRMGWLPGKPKECPCGSDHTSRRHLLDCPLVPMALFEQLPQPDQDQIHRIDFAITSLPLSSQEPRPAYWIPLLTILWHIDVICNPDGDYSHETEHGALWI